MDKKRIEEINEEILELEEKYKELEECNNEKEFIDFLDENYEQIGICGYIMYPSHVLKECDPVAFRKEHFDYNDSRMTDIRDEIDGLKEELKGD